MRCASNNGLRNLFCVLASCVWLGCISPVQAQPLNFTTLAGSAGRGSVDGDAGNSRFSAPGGIAIDNAGNVYVADTENHTIRKISGGLVTTLAGSPGISGSADGNGSVARFNQPQGVAIDANGTLYVADTGNHAIRIITAAGVVSTLAGAVGNPGSLNASGTNAQFYEPEGVAVKPDGSLIYVADTWNHTIRQITSTGVVTTFAGSAGNSGTNNGTGGSARFYQPQGIALDATGNIYVGDTGNGTIRKITTGGVVTTFAGTPGLLGSMNGTGSSAQFYQPMGLAVDTNGTVYVADNFNHTIRAINANRTATTFAGIAGTYGSDDGAGNARFFSPQGVAVNGDTVYVADTGNNTIRRINDGLVTTVAGSASIGSGDGVGNGAKFYWAQGAAIDSTGNVFVADTFNHTIRKVTQTGTATTPAGAAGNPGSSNGPGASARFYSPQGVALDSGGNLYIADAGNHAIRKMSPDGNVSTLAGSVGNVGYIDGVGASAQFNNPSAVALDNAANVYVADTGNHTIRKITSGGVVTTLAGIAGVYGTLDSNMDNAGTNTARFNSPAGVVVDGTGNVYVSDTGNHTVRKISAAGVVSTVAGLPGVWGSVDGVNRTARFFRPRGITLDSQGNLFVMDSGNHIVRMLSPSATNWIVSTVGGQTDVAGNTDGIGSHARFDYPSAIALNAAGVFAIADSANSIIRIGQPPVARFESITRLGNGAVQLDMSGLPSTNYTLLFTTNWTAWNTLITLPSSDGLFHYIDLSASTNGLRFYRMRLGL